MTYDCMTVDELAGWQEAAAKVHDGGAIPCFDCPAWFSAEARARGCCNRAPQATGRPIYTDSTDEQRARWRAAYRRRTSR